MGLENPLHIILILLVVLLVFGAKRLPEMGRSLGDGVKGFRDAMSGQPAPTPQATIPSAPSYAPNVPAVDTTIAEANPETVPAPAPASMPVPAGAASE